MRKLLITFVILGTASAPALSQTTSPTQPPQAEKPKTVTKVVCERIEVEQTTGSRLGSAPKVCKKVKVPVEDKAAKSQPQGHSADAH